MSSVSSGSQMAMQDALALLILEAAHDLSQSSQETLRAIARTATRATSRGPVVVACYDVDGQLDRHSVHFERADKSYTLRALQWQQIAPLAVRHLALSLTPRAINCQSEAFKQLPGELQARARKVFPLCVMANTGDGGGLHIAFGNPDMGEWPPARIRHFHAIAQHLAVAWRIRTTLNVANMPPVIAAEFRVDATPTNLSPDASAPTAREALRRAVIARERARTGRRSATDQELWPALVAGRWSLIDAFTAGGTRYIVAYENPAETTALRALRPQERILLEYALAGRSGKWAALELELSESAVTRTLRTALRRIGVADTAALAGVRTALFEPLECLNAGVALAMTRLTPAALSLATLSDAERAIVAAILGGKRIAAIARERETSSRTVAHQIASIYKKLDVSSRRELLALLT